MGEVSEVSKAIEEGLEPVVTEEESDTAPVEGIGLCLSGGGYRAMLFHLGAFLRLYELGLLQRILGTTSLTGGQWLLCIALAAGLLLVGELIKLVFRWRGSDALASA